MSASILNISSYHFKILDNLEELKKDFLEKGLELELKGTILIAPEGFNLFISAVPTSVYTFLKFFSEKLGICYETLDLKESWNEKIAFNRFLVRIKKEIIAFDKKFNFDYQAPYISAEDLEEKLDNKEEIVLIDTRNDYETYLGKFKNAFDPCIKTFKQFKESLSQLKHLKDKTIVTYCTGGIRCEKAAVYLKEEGFKNVFQLKGGILKYFEKTKADHYEGECFVFDKRVTLTKKLKASDKKLCYACRKPLSEIEFTSHHYIEGQSCPHCIKGVVNAN